MVNPIANTLPVPRGSCLVTGEFESEALRITGKQERNIVITVSLSTNHSFEWEDTYPNQKWEPAKGENIVDMGIRGGRPRKYCERTFC